MRKLFYSFLLSILTMSTYAGGFQSSIQSQRMVAMGHTGVGIVMDVSTIYFNPAGMSFINDNRWNVNFGGSLVFSNAVYANPDTGYEHRNESVINTPFNVYASYKVNEDLSVGLGVYTPFGSGIDWTNDWQGSHLINDITLSAIYIQPTVSYKIGDNFSVGAGFIYALGGVNLNKNLSQDLVGLDGSRASVELDGTAHGYGYQAGVYYEKNAFSAGVTYKSTITAKAEDQTATFSDVPGVLGSAGITNGESTFTAELPLPGSVNVGLGYRINEKWTVALDYNYVFWSEYDSLDFDFGGDIPDSNNPRNYENTSAIRLGAQYVVNEKWSVRAGTYYDQSPIQDDHFSPETPSCDNLVFTGGFSYLIKENISLDVAFLYINGLERESSYDYYVDPVDGSGNERSFGGIYEVDAFAPTFGLTMSF